jgi:beta-N-acetylhexosaminidase
MKELRTSSGLVDEIGQLFMAGMPGPRLDEGTVSLIRDFNLGGIILFARNVEDPLQVARLCLDLQECSAAYGRSPLFLAVDQEGGRVARLRGPFTLFPGNAALGAAEDGEAKAVEFGSITAREMKLVGLNMNLAPVVDVQRGEMEKHLAGRSFGEDPRKVAFLGRTVVRSLQENGVMSVAKHFPGLGRTSLDPHFHLPRIDIGREELEVINLPPFKAAVEEGVSGIMSSHAVYPALDAERPATLSPIVLGRLLRGELRFGGLVITDDLEMGAISNQWSVAEAAASALDAGADILLICKEQKNVLEAMERIKNRISEGTTPIERLRDSCERIRSAKSRFLGEGKKVSLREVKEYFGEALV